MSTQELAKKLHQLKELQRMSEEITAEAETIKDEIKRTMTEKGVDTLTVDVYKISWKSVTSSRLDTTALKKELPDVAARYTKTTESRRFLVS
ncbi:MAG: hypothetical protein NC299_16965 [Lachnospiraceae bacterium]|nr:hypothetical protein [Ruminococcus sp.]MCM1277023.1 hypothetical protein [Lachnospiraceae bacterium]